MRQSVQHPTGAPKVRLRFAVRNADPPITKEGRNGTEAGVEAKGKELSTKRVTLTSATTRDDNRRR